MPLNLEAKRKKTAISLTPLIDVVFILLLFFMLTSSFVAWRVVDTPLSAPSTDQATPPVEQVKFTFVLKQNDGFVWLDQQRIGLQDGEFFRDLIQQNSEALFILDAEAGVNLQSLLTLADQLKLQGAKTVSIANAFKEHGAAHNP
ncbi:biopolymer transporter ExbD [Maribrevibacterium harenarium]|uniref:Biopolymer transporter ExbD n=1 Tax=Maribrevibacterium harenarium TaxID=2589817 RepID=A0A501WX85_9GAMM|nr:biopolymer transporter ExbD [Maribrevibacterium harenarium]TPE54088.1 biopolymer transporter ExbD [Maribrevibacterium harenarium]